MVLDVVPLLDTNTYSTCELSGDNFSFLAGFQGATRLARFGLHTRTALCGPPSSPRAL